jgi:NAD(P)-dependent dehydrogenase (short-subunit alcohol dehydrogenase family)
MEISIKGQRALVTGANRGIGLGFVQGLLEAGAAHVYATARDVGTLDTALALDPARTTPVGLDVTSEQQAIVAAESLTDVTMLINNAGIVAPVDYRTLLGAKNLDDARAEMETNYWGMLHVCRAFAPVLIANGGGVIVNVLSVGGMAVFPQVGTYCASKYAANGLTRGIRAELAPHGTHVTAVFTGAVATDMSKNTPGKKVTPLEHANSVLGDVVRGREESYPEFLSQRYKRMIDEDEKAFERSLRARLDS